MNNDPSTEAAYRSVHRGLLARIAILEGQLFFWQLTATGMTAVVIIITALKCNR